VLKCRDHIKGGTTTAAYSVRRHEGPERSETLSSFCLVLTDAALTPAHTHGGASRSESDGEEEEVLGWGRMRR